MALYFADLFQPFLSEIHSAFVASRTEYRIHSGLLSRFEALRLCRWSNAVKLKDVPERARRVFIDYPYSDFCRLSVADEREQDQPESPNALETIWSTVLLDITALRVWKSFTRLPYQ